MKKSVLVSLVLMMAAPLNVMAQKHQFSNGLYWELNGTTLTISGNGPMEDFRRPWEDPWEAPGTVEKVVIGNGVTAIGESCFSEIEKPHHLKSVVIGNSVKSIGGLAFCSCSCLTSVSIPNSVTSIGDGAFQDCSSLTSISIPNSVKSIGDWAFGGCSSLASISIPNSVTSIGDGAFLKCTSLTSISIPNSVTSIGYRTFSECSSLTTIHSLPNSVIEGGLSEWSRIDIPKEVVERYKEEIQADIFNKKSGLSSTRISKNGANTYYIVSKNSRYGLVNTAGQEIVPPELDAIEECGKGFLRFKVNGYWGVMNYAGKIIIPTDRGYTKIGDYVSFTKRFPYEMNGYKGECNNLGQQVSKIKTGSATASTSSSSSSTKTTSSTASTSSRKSNTNNQTQTIVVQHQRDPIPVQEWQQCMRCGGSGQCSFDACCGSGWYFRGDRRVICVSCHGSGKCQGCAGQGGHYITVYR